MQIPCGETQHLHVDVTYRCCRNHEILSDCIAALSTALTTAYHLPGPQIMGVILGMQDLQMNSWAVMEHVGHTDWRT